MSAKEMIFSRKNRAAQALQAAQILFPSSSSASPVDNSVQAIFQRLKLSADEDVVDAGQHHDGVDGQRIEEETIDKKDVLKRAAERGLDMLEIIQDWLVMEVDKVDSGSTSTDFLLSIQQRALVQRITQHVIAFLLLPTLKDLCDYVATGQPMSAEVSVFKSFVEPFQRILQLSVPTSIQNPSQSASGAEASGRPPQHITYVTQTFRNTTTLVHLMASAILVGWYEAVARDPTSPVYRLSRGFLDSLGGRTETISVLGGVVRLAAPKPTNIGTRDPRKVENGAADTDKVNVRWPPYVMAVARAMMARQITLPLGVMGLMNCVFDSGLGKTEVIDMRKLEYLAMCLSTPVNESLESFLGKIVPQLIKILAPGTEVSSNRPPAYTNAASFCMSSLIARHTTITMSLLSPLIHSPFKPEAGLSPPAFGQEGSDMPHAAVVRHPQEIGEALSILLPLLTSTPPTSVVITQTVTPILPQLFALAVHLQTDRTADPLTRQELQDILRTWARLADREVVIKGIWDILHSGRGWGVTDEEGNEFFWNYVEDINPERSGVGIWYGTPATEPVLAVHTAEEIDTSRIKITSKSDHGNASPTTDFEAYEEDMLSKVDLIPSPKDIVALLKKAERKEVTSGVYFRCLQAYQELAQLPDTDEAHTKTLLLYLQLIMLITESMSDALGDQTQKVLIFIEQALRSSTTEKESIKAQDRESAADSDDEEENDLEANGEEPEPSSTEDLDANNITKLGLMETAIHLLLATLQSNSRLGVENLPILTVISSHVEVLARHRLATVRAMARNARLLLSIQKAVGQNENRSVSGGTRTSTMEQYQEALRCLQDPLLPVRGHGLIILQNVVKASDFDKALVPAIMDIFLQALRDDDSFMYLNAVRGLSRLVDGLGKEILQSLASAYTEGIDKGSSLRLSQEDLDRRLRIGEALTQAVKRCGTALSIYADVLVPRLIRVFPQAALPTVMRASSLSVLSTCVDVDWRAILPWVQDLLGACLDLLQLESVRSSGISKRKEDGNAPDPASEPIRANDSKHPALRRAALVFLGQLFNAVAISEKQEHETSNIQLQSSRSVSMNVTANQAARNHEAYSPPVIHPGLMQKAGNVLGYLEATDIDSLAAHQAGEALYLLRQLRWPVGGAT